MSHGIQVYHVLSTDGMGWTVKLPDGGLWDVLWNPSVPHVHMGWDGMDKWCCLTPNGGM